MADQESVDDAWTGEIGPRVDDSRAGSRPSPASRFCPHRRPAGRGRRMTVAFDFHPEARSGVGADVDWYDDRVVGVGGRFAEAIRAAIYAALDDPAARATWPGWDRERVERSKGVTGFP